MCVRHWSASVDDSYPSRRRTTPHGADHFLLRGSGDLGSRGILLVPVLALYFGVDLRYAMGASIVSVIATSSGAAAAYLRTGLSNVRIGFFLVVATVSGAITGALLAGVVPTRWL